MTLHVKVGPIGVLDMLKFKNMKVVREKEIQKAPAKEIVAEFAINKNAKILHPDNQKLIVDEIIDRPGAGAKTFVFRRKDGNPCAYFKAGQYLSFKLKIGDSFITRPYSISSSPKDALEGKVAVTVKANPGGFGSDWILNNLHIGDEITASDAQGQFCYEDLRDAKNVIALAGGSGITPFLSMAQAIRDGIEDFNLTIIFGSRTKESILFYEELEEISQVCPNITVVHVLSEEKKEGYEHGFITADLIKKHADEPYSIFICGPSAMYSFLEKELEKLELPRRSIRRELLGVVKDVSSLPDYPQDAKGQTFTMTVRQGFAEHTLDVCANEPILQAIERAGIVAPSRCRSGECGWCRSKLASGTVYVPKETDGRRFSDIQHDYIHPCATFATSDIVLELPGEYVD